MDNIFIAIMVAAVVGGILFLTYHIPKQTERDNRAKAISEQMGCEYIGSARDLGSVKFLDCNGEIKAIRVKE